ncbi:MAG: hypothetical protein QW666_01570 [Candidatus Woesearchaeota archaeon]
MALFGFLKKKGKEEIELPPPPSPPEEELSIPSEPEIPPIHAGMPSVVELPKPEYEKKEIKPEYEKLEFPEIPAYEKEEEFEAAQPTEEEAPRVFDKTLKETFPTREDVFAPKKLKPMFVAVDEFKNLASNTKVIRAKLMTAEEHVARLSDVKNQKERILERWRGLLEDAEKKISYVDAVLEKAQG